MFNKLKRWLVFFPLATSIAFLFLVGCRSAQTAGHQDFFNRYVHHQCQAFLLREQRYALADRLRFLQDSLQNSSAGDTISLHLRLTQWLQQKEAIYQHSVSLADTLGRMFDTVKTIYLVNKEKEKVFNDKLAEALAKKGCQ
jgi:hypothetical protein